MKTRHILLSLSLLMISLPTKAQVSSFDDCNNVGNPANFAFQNGESITLVANYKWGLVNTSVGEAVLKLSKEDYNNQIHFVANVNIKTYGFFDNFFKVRDHFITKFSAENMRPAYFYQDTREGKYTKKCVMYFDWAKKKVSGTKQRKTAPETSFIADLYGCTFDFISFLYYLRNIDFDAIKANSELKVTFALDDVQKTLNVKYKGTQKIKTKAGKFDAVEVVVQLLENETFASQPEMALYLSNDKNHIPLYVEMPLKIGSVRISLSEYYNLKFPITSKEKN